ncbi:MAG: outer membrane beta-barrel protein [bacterium]|jgi:opacity protein-like surface antigen|nr:outer membrane beta-barrel protein [Betaproteobacteria bacterium]
MTNGNAPDLDAMTTPAVAPVDAGGVAGFGLRAARGALAAAALLVAMPAMAQSPSATGWYTGFGMGQSRLGFKTGDFNIGPAGTSVAFDENNTAFKFFAGYRVLPWLAIEGGYDNLGRNAVNFTNVGGGAKLDYKVDALKLTGVGTFALGNTGFSAFGKVGFGYTRVRENSSSFPVVMARGELSEREWKISPVIGAGLQYQLPRGLALRAEYEVYNEVGDSPLPTGRARAGLWSMSLMYLF